MRAAEPHPDPLLGGFYTVREAARLLRIENKQRIYRWLTSDDAVLARDYEPVTGSQELSFWDLFEVRFVETFRAQGLSLQFIRKVATKARAEFKTQHPFALSGSKYLTDRKRIFRLVAEETGEKTHDVLSGQYEMYETIERLLEKGVEFNPKTLLAQEWPPYAECPIEKIVSDMSARECYRPPWNISEEGGLDKVKVDYQNVDKWEKRQTNRAAKAANSGEENKKAK
jgi:hypothetical protein